MKDADNNSEHEPAMTPEIDRALVSSLREALGPDTFRMVHESMRRLMIAGELGFVDVVEDRYWKNLYEGDMEGES